MLTIGTIVRYRRQVWTVEDIDMLGRYILRGITVKNRLGFAEPRFVKVAN